MRIRVARRQVRAWVDWVTSLEHFEVQVIAGGATGIPFKADRLANDNLRAVGGGESLEMSIEIRPVTRVKNAVSAEPSGATLWV